MEAIQKPGRFFMNPATQALLTDFYQLTMAYGYWRNGMEKREAVFHHFYRKNPFNNGYLLAVGLEQAIHFFEAWKFSTQDLDYLSDLKSDQGRPMFEEAFLKTLGDWRFDCDVDAVKEGTLVFPHEPIMRLRGPLLTCQLLETPLLNTVNFQSLIATKAARISYAAKGDPVLEFGSRRAQGPDGALSASRAAYVGGCSATSNVLAGKVFNIPVKGTHAHSWVMAHESEQAAFDTYVDAMPENSILLVDTFDTITGVKRAIETGKRLQEKGFSWRGIRLDSGNLASLSRKARTLLDEAGFTETIIVASNDLDEFAIRNLKAQDAAIDVWGVGTKLVTAHGQPALGGVYKLSAIRDTQGNWQEKVKLSEQMEKASNPGILQVQRHIRDNHFRRDVIFNELQGRPKEPKGYEVQDLLIPIFRGGQRVYQLPNIEQIKGYAQKQKELLAPEYQALENPANYPVSLDPKLHDLKTTIMAETTPTVEKVF
jgi:nicotinate phosphoribosyltransferase